MSTKRKNGSKAQSDFKRLKAKVGKRAPKSANLTDTSFKAASLHLTGQSVHRSSSSQESEIVLSSERGNTILDLSTQISHPAAAVRLSAIKGLSNIVRNQQSYLLRPHLATLVPTIAKAFVDEDDEVRAAGLAAFGELLLQYDDSSIQPFVLLIVAYVTSALHSLDSQMRVDGAKAVNLFCTSGHPSLIRPFVSKLLYPFVSLLADRNKLKASPEILQSLVHLLEVSVLQLHSSSSSNRIGGHHSSRDSSFSFDKDPDLSFLLGGRSRNAILVEGRKRIHYHHHLKSFTSIKDLPSFDELLSTNASFLDAADSIENKGVNSEFTMIHDLLEKLRDVLVETIEEDDTQDTGRKASTTPRTERLLLIVKAIGLLWKRKIKRLQDTEKLDKMAFQTISIVLDMFPLRLGDFKGMDVSSTDNLNSTICTTVMDVASSISPDLFHDADGNKLDWMRSLASFLLPRLEDFKEDKNYSSLALKVFCELLLLSFNKENFSQSSQLSMLKRLEVVFFQTKDNATACSPAGRKIALVVVEMMKRVSYSVDEAGPVLKDALTNILRGLPFYLNSWGSDFCFESSEILGLFHHMARSNSIDVETFQLIQDGMGQLVIANRKGMGKSKRSTFELYPLSIQRQFLALIVMFGQPSNEILKGLSATCSKSTICPAGVTPETADEIVTAIEAIRKSVSMKDYLTFLLNIVATPPAKSKKKMAEPDSSLFGLKMERVELLDLGVQRASYALCQCGSERVLQMLLPHFTSLLDTKLKIAPADKYLRIRVAISIIAMLALNVQSAGKDFRAPLAIQHSFKQSLLEMLVFTSSSESLMKERVMLISPLVALCKVDSSLLMALFEIVVSTWNEYQSRQSLQNNIIQLLIDIVSDRRLSETIHGLTSLSGSLETLRVELQKVKGSHNELVGQLNAILEVKIGK